MIFKKETEVEVLEKGEGPLGSWRPAIILSGNGHTYGVKYENSPKQMAALMNKVARKALRPRPPLVEVISWACGDFVEVFESGSWKLAEILRTIDLNMVVAKFLESSKEIVAPLFLLRMPQTWKGNHWIPLQKEFVQCRNVDVNSYSKVQNLSSQLPRLSIEELNCKRVDLCAENYGDAVDLWLHNSRKLLKKRPGECGLPFYPEVGAAGSKKLFKKEERCYKLTGMHLTNQAFKKVDAANSPLNSYGGKHMNDAFYHETAGFGQISVCCQNSIANAGLNPVVSSNILHNDSTTSSVGSCSVINGFCRPLHHKTSQRKELCDYIDDAESCCGSPTKSSHDKEDEMPEAIHCLELDAYRTTLRSLYSLGSLSWDQESLLTNLRLALNISNDEHLSELKDLMSTGS